MRWTVRLRLTLLYGGLFLICGAAVLTVTYALVRHGVPAPGSGPTFNPGNPPEPGRPSVPVKIQGNARVMTEQALEAQRADVLDKLLVNSVIALGLIVLLALALGWWMAGRILRRLRTVTTAAREISATNLHRRLALPGPDDELKELGDTFDELLGRLERSFQAQRQFVANASHELRTPLARQRAIGQVALADPDADVASLRAAHERVLAAGVQQERLIEAMLTLTRSHAGIDVRHTFDLGEVVREVVSSRSSPPVPIRTSIGACPVSGHRALAERLVTNLVDNALQHNVADGWVSVTCADGVLTVTNTGPVVPAVEVERLFQPFQRLGPARTGEGQGLGLSIVQAVANAHGAAVAAVARPSGGLEIRVRFPLVPGRGVAFVEYVADEAVAEKAVGLEGGDGVGELGDRALQ